MLKFFPRNMYKSAKSQMSKLLVIRTKRETWKWFSRGRFGHTLRDCRRKKESLKWRGVGNSKTCNMCEQDGHIARGCTPKDPKSINDAAMVALPVRQWKLRKILCRKN